MKLSMWILADWLGEFAPSLHIIEGKAGLTGTRLYSAGSPEQDPSAAIIGDAAQMLPRGSRARTDAVLCLNGEDWLLFDHGDVGVILNACLEAFEFYNAWESAIKDVAYASPDAPFEKLLDLSSPVLKNPILVADWKGEVLAISRNHKPIADRETWEHWVDQGYFPSYTYDRLKNYPQFLEDMNRSEEIRIFDFPQFEYRCIHFSVRYNNETSLYVHIIEDDTKLTEGLIQVASVLKQTIAIVLDRSNVMAKTNQIVSLFSDIIAGKYPERDALVWVRSQLGWDKSKAWYLVIFRNFLPESFSETALLEVLKKQVRKGCSFIWENHPIMIVDCEEWSVAFPKIKKLLGGSGFCCGVSMPFDKQKDLPFALNQAKLSMELSDGKNTIAMCEDCAWSYIVNEIKSQITDMQMLHPAVKVLQEHDRQTGGQLTRTLYEYLRHERSADATSKALFIHRNSLRYRLDRIEELIDADLNDPDTRMYIILSYEIKEMTSS